MKNLFAFYSFYENKLTGRKFYTASELFIYFNKEFPKVDITKRQFINWLNDFVKEKKFATKIIQKKKQQPITNYKKIKK